MFHIPTISDLIPRPKAHLPISSNVVGPRRPPRLPGGMNSLPTTSPLRLIRAH